MRLLFLIVLLIFSCKKSDSKKKKEVNLIEPEIGCTLINGKYRVISDDSWNQSTFIIEVNHDTLLEIFTNKTIKYLIKSKHENTIFIERLSKIDTTNLSDFEKIIMSQTHFYDNLICKNDTIYFTQKIDLNIISLSGKCIKL